ncbi:unnamed protein product [Psylliodes chrysocephalus]|uniref:Serine/threonine-protein phosphatase 2A activator n=1 Tax=Psylliodes chrysocephalus TaxID=3402493 RepID=A0A9P0GLX0_9CUCU|nr:unnamed protein product [Psylliodes chrysocephala]
MDNVIDSEKHVYIMPTKMVKNISDMLQWDKSEAYFEYLGFIYSLNDSIRGKTNSEASHGASPEIEKLCVLLETLNGWIDEIPPVQQPQRFGNQAFKVWYNRLKDDAIVLLQKVVPDRLYRAVPEIMVYLIEGFGNSIRIDYGTGHELSFIMFLCALFKIGFLKFTDQPATACKVFVRYLQLVRRLQKTYRMEPAGSHGVWSLDDYQFVPFIWGSAQFIGTGKFDTTCFLKDNIVRENSSEYMFLSCIQYINEVKTGPFAEHSNQLWSISGVSTWSKINSGLIKMYKAEVLSKFPLVQHIFFGSVFTLTPAGPGASVRKPKTNLLSARMPSKEFKEPGTRASDKSSSQSDKSFSDQPSQILE